MIILVINCGSSSIKYQLLDMKSDDIFDVIAKGIAEKIGLPEGILQYAPAGRQKIVRDLPIADHKVGMQLILEALTDPETGVLKSLEDIEAVGHRIVQGGDFFSGSALVNDDVLKKIDFCSDFAPLHNPAHLLGIEAIQHVLPSVPQVVTFDTAFHQTMPAYAYMYGLPYEYYEKYRVRRYGAHGTSHQFVAQQGAKFCGLDFEHSKIITCHLGAGSSVCAIKDGKCVDTSMGFSPLEGMIMGTRVGNIDANAVIYLENKLGVTPDEMSTILNRKSGFLGVSQQTSDARELDELANNGDQAHRLLHRRDERRRPDRLHGRHRRAQQPAAPPRAGELHLHGPGPRLRSQYGLGRGCGHHRRRLHRQGRADLHQRGAGHRPGHHAHCRIT